jgi:hypothetical protein
MHKTGVTVQAVGEAVGGHADTLHHPGGRVRAMHKTGSTVQIIARAHQSGREGVCVLVLLVANICCRDTHGGIGKKRASLRDRYNRHRTRTEPHTYGGRTDGGGGAGAMVF